MSRISRDQMYMGMAWAAAGRGTCDRARVGAVLVDPDNNVVAIGYNGSPMGEEHCDDVGHLMYHNHCIRTIHAEENCLNKIRLLPCVDFEHYTLYVTHYPCAKCQITLYERAVSSEAQLLVVYDKLYGEETAFSGLSEIQPVIQFSKIEVEPEQLRML